MRLGQMTIPSSSNSQLDKSRELLHILERMIEIVETKELEDKPLALTVKQAAEQLQVSVPTLREHFLCRPDFPKVRAGTRFLIPRKALEEWLNSQASINHG
ncbi:MULTISPECIES: helix-turn-helix domain-containing protein [unclassified Thermoactinomyces]|uniref:helix-turn-helix domain-containing protein n=1 Tax=unclassified Thermoactinomyces TaxID=2634588 RepID=UPI0018DE12CD|nr:MULTISPECIES: helix-turn-helix domain-containing protein [unclassified Thermoactinomyces]MBH8599102.1 helix-turn-helix domain-containing protein [Thermoactinomyces sp. CICC 10523]MBH8607966.1 helix-turn-helix domain-containing protein [Thermoactinomyces sp. CICC 10521]